ncbi:unnamed protein product, partial [Nesidiocoris tenuis]
MDAPVGTPPWRTAEGLTFLMVRKSESRPRLRYQRHQIGVILRPRVPSLSGVRVRPSPSLSDTRLRPEHAHHIGAN